MGSRVGIPDSAVEQRAKRYGIELSELQWDKFDDCVTVVLQADAERTAPKED